jgi:hypothetical protein
VSDLNGPVETNRKDDEMPIITTALLIVFATCSALTTAQAQQSNSCKQCGDQRRACMSGYSGKTCQTEYERCMKNCKAK